LAGVTPPEGTHESPPWHEGWSGCLLHGFGASAHDLVGLAPRLGVAKRWLFPHAPVPITVAGMSYGRAWFPRDDESVEQALFGGYFVQLRSLTPEGLRRAADEVRNLLDARGVDWSRFVLGGFSQGAMVAAEILRQGTVDRRLPLPAAVVLFSGALVAEAWWNERPASPSPEYRPAVFQSHGTSDAVLPLSEGRALRDAIISLGFSVEWSPFDGRHEIPPPTIGGAAAFLHRALT
ncbi:MAG: hypothetical protein MI724_07095, partial [Spirochaetales bacterium]|nr:hypothetical protein [Spirochaetales bacterium]